MADWKYVIHFQTADGRAYWSRIDTPEIPGGTVPGYASFNDAVQGGEAEEVVIEKVEQTHSAIKQI